MVVEPPILTPEQIPNDLENNESEVDENDIETSPV